MRIHFASAMTMLGYNDGDDAQNGVSYLELAEFIQKHSPENKKDLEQLWRRIVFNVLVSNTDDHLRNHGFILTSKGWTLSPAYNMNPNPFGGGLSLNINENDNSQDIDITINVSKYFKLTESESYNILNEIKTAVKEWEKIAKNLKISNFEIDNMKSAFIT